MPANPLREPWIRRYQVRPWPATYKGLGVLCTVLLFIVLWWLLSFLYTPLAFWSQPAAGPAGAEQPTTRRDGVAGGTSARPIAPTKTKGYDRGNHQLTSSRLSAQGGAASLL